MDSLQIAVSNLGEIYLRIIFSSAIRPSRFLDRGSIRVDDLLATSMDPREDVIQSDQLLKKTEERLQGLAKLKLLELRRSILFIGFFNLI